jgi:hypothetical protein
MGNKTVMDKFGNAKCVLSHFVIIMLNLNLPNANIRQNIVKTA